MRRALTFSAALPRATAWAILPHDGVPRHEQQRCIFQRPLRVVAVARKTTTTTTQLFAFALTSAIEDFPWGNSDTSPESLAQSTMIGWRFPDELAYQQPDDHDEAPTKDDEQQRFPCFPLYPLPTVYIPYTSPGWNDDSMTALLNVTNHTLVNIEPRNVQMALDLEHRDDRRFVAVWRAIDTGRLAAVGTLLRIVDMEKHVAASPPSINQNNPELDSYQTLERIVLTCQAEDLVHLNGILNPQSAHLGYRLQNPTEYLKCQVQIQPPPPHRDSPNLSSSQTGEEWQQCRELSEVFNSVRSCLLQGKGAQDLPPYLFNDNHLDHHLPILTPENFCGRAFWHSLQVWQSLALTIQQGRQLQLSQDRNELLVAAALRKGGPLQLPVHLEDLTPTDRQAVQALEQRAQAEYAALQMEPCHDVQHILTMTPNRPAQLRKLLAMMRREEQRLQALDPYRPPTEPIPLPRPRKGAWFD